MAKDKKKKKKDKAGKAAPGTGAKVAKQFGALANSRLVADIVAAALVATASALKDNKKARALAASAGDELEQLAKEGAERGNAMWKLALQVGRRALDTLNDQTVKPTTAPKAPKVPKAPKAPKTAKPPKPSAKTARKAK